MTRWRTVSGGVLAGRPQPVGSQSYRVHAPNTVARLEGHNHTPEPSHEHWVDRDVAALKAIAVEEGSQEAITTSKATRLQPKPTPDTTNAQSPDVIGEHAKTPRAGSKLARVIDLLQRCLDPGNCGRFHGLSGGGRSPAKPVSGTQNPWQQGKYREICSKRVSDGI